jgi:hypothetical protein
MILAIRGRVDRRRRGQTTRLFLSRSLPLFLDNRITITPLSDAVARHFPKGAIAMATDLRTVEVPNVVVSKLRRVRGRKTRMRLSTAIVGAAAVLFATMLLAMLIDWYVMPVSTLFRSMLTVAALATAGVALARWTVDALFRGRSLAEVASDVDHSLPRIQERWSTITELHAAPREHQDQFHPAMLRQVSREAAQWEPHVEPRDVISAGRLYRGFAAATAALVLLFVLMVADWQQTSVLLRRFWAPQSPITFTEIELTSTIELAAEGEPVKIEATLAGRPVDEATLLIQPMDGPQEELLLIPSGDDHNELSHRIRAAEKSFDFRLMAGDGRTDWQHVDVATRPKLAGIRFNVTPPEYTGRKPQTLKDLPPTATIIEGSKLELEFLPKEPVDQFRLQTDEEQFTNLTPDDDGWYRWSQVVAEDLTLSPLLTESHGLENRHPPYCHVHVYRDQAPAVRVVTPDKQMAVRPDEKIELQFRADDDFAIGKAELIVFQEPTELGGEAVELAVREIPLADQLNKKRVQGSIDLDLSEFDVEDGHELTYSIRVYDTRQAPIGDAMMAQLQSSEGDQSAQTDTDGGAEYNMVQATPGEASPTVESAQPTASQTASRNAQPNPANSTNNSTNNSTGNQTDNPQSGAPATEPTDGDSAEQLASTEDISADTPPLRIASLPETTRSTDPANAATQPTPRQPLAGATPAADSAGTPPTNAMASDAPSPEADASADTPISETTAQTGSNDAQNADDSAAAEPSQSQVAAGGNNQQPPPGATPRTGASQTASGGRPSSSATAAADPAESEAGQQAQDGQSPEDAPATAATDRRPLMARSDPAAADREQAASQDQSASDASGSPNQTASSDPSESRNAAQRNEQMAANSGQSSSSSGNPSNSSQQQQMAANSQSASQPGGNSQQGQNQPGPQSDIYVPEGGKMADFNPDIPDEPSEESNGEAGAPRPGDNMSRRMMDIAQVGTSGRQRLKIDQWAGSFEGQQREKLALAIAPVLEELDGHLERAENRTHELVGYLEKSAPWSSEQDRGVGLSDAALEEAQRVVAQLERQAADTPYSFISLQIVDIDQVHIAPARDSLWTTLQSDDGRLDHVRNAWQNIGRARDRLAGLVQQFQRIRREHRLADQMQTVKKMYQVYVEDAYRLLGSEGGSINNYERKMAEFDLDEEYLARLQEVLEMRRDLMSELSRILSDDPRLLRRYMDRFVDRQDSLRDQLTLQSEQQERLERELRAWMRVDEERRPTLAGAITRLRLAEAAEISDLASRLSERFMAWLPLDMEVKDGELLRARDMSNEVAASARELQSAAATYRPPAPTATQNAENGAENGAASSTDQLGVIAASGRQVYEQLIRFEAALRGVSMESRDTQVATHVVNRLTESKELIERVSAWVRKLEELSTGQYHRAAAIDQHQLATETQELAGKLANLEAQLAGAVGAGSNQLPEEIADKTRRLLTLFDNQLSPNQLGATYSLRQNRLPAAAVRQRNAVTAYAEAEKLFDEIIQESIKILDELPVQDPIASLLDDPTLDQLLAELENEQLLAEDLGIPLRPSNLSVMGDWLRPQRGSGISGQMRMMINARLREQQRRTEDEMQQAYQEALARALKEMERLAKTAERENKGQPRAQQVDWNVLVAELREDLMQGRGKMPPEEFRRAIEQYFDLISRAKSQEAESSRENE